MQVIVPVPFTVDSTTVAAPDSADGEVAWSSGGSYVKFDRVYRSTTRLIYECRQTIISDTVTPEQWVLDFARYEGVEGAYANQERWRVWGPCNADKMFDQAVGTLTLAASPLVVELLPESFVGSIAVLGVTAGTVQVEVYDGASLVYDTTFDMGDFGTVSDWYDYWFGTIVRRSDVILTDLPPITGARIVVTVSDTDDVTVGTCILGNVIDFGDTEWSPQVSLTSYSTKAVSAAGVTSVTPGPRSKRVGIKVVCPTYAADMLIRTLSDLEDTPIVMLGAPDQFEALTVYGFFKGWSMDIAYANKSYLSGTLESLT